MFQNLALKNDTKSLNWWIKPPIEPLLKVHIFNYTNMDRFMQGKDDKIKVHDVGPYVYREQGEKIKLVFHDDHKITYYENITQKFDENLSRGLTEGDIFHLPNVPLIVAMSEILKTNFIKQIGFNTMVLASSAPKQFQVHNCANGKSEIFENNFIFTINRTSALKTTSLDTTTTLCKLFKHSNQTLILPVRDY